MPYTDEPPGLRLLNNLNTSTFGSVVTNAAYLFGSVMLTVADYQLLTSAVELARQAGLFLAGILVGAWTGKTVAGVVDAQNKRKLNPAAAPVLEAQERGKATGTAQALALATAAKKLHVADPPAPPAKVRRKKTTDAETHTETEEEAPAP